VFQNNIYIISSTKLFHLIVANSHSYPSIHPLAKNVIFFFNFRLLVSKQLQKEADFYQNFIEVKNVVLDFTKFIRFLFQACAKWCIF